MSSIAYAALASLAQGRPRSPVHAVPKGTPYAAYRRLNVDIRAMGRRAGIDKTATHDLRRSFGRLWWKDGRNLAVLTRVCGHASLNITPLHRSGRSGDGRRDGPVLRLVPGGAAGGRLAWYRSGPLRCAQLAHHSS